jgi:hypothetical protein
VEITIGLIVVLALIGVVWIVLRLIERGEEYNLSMFSSFQFLLIAVGTVFTFLYLINAGKFVAVDKEGYTFSFSSIEGGAQKLKELETTLNWDTFKAVEEKSRQSNEQNKADDSFNAIKEIFLASDSSKELEDKLQSRGFKIGTVGGRYNALLCKICYIVFFGVSLFLNVRQSNFGFGLAYTCTQAVLCALTIVAVILFIFMALAKNDKRKRRRRA